MRRSPKSTNHLLVVGFYLVNIGFITLTLSLGNEPTTYPEAIRFLSSKVGLAVLVLGGMHFFNMTAIARFGRKVNDWLTDRRTYETFAGLNAQGSGRPLPRPLPAFEDDEMKTRESPDICRSARLGGSRTDFRAELCRRTGSLAAP